MFHSRDWRSIKLACFGYITKKNRTFDGGKALANINMEIG